MRRTSLALVSLVAASVVAPVAAFAQAAPPPPASDSRTASISGARSGHGRGLGLGAVAPLEGNVDALVTWGNSGGQFHIDGLFGLRRHGETNFDLGARFWYHVHAASFADLSLGAGGALISIGRPEPADRQYHFALEFGAQMRAFVVSNVALLGTVGLGARLNDGGDDVITVGGQAVASLGVAYYFE